MLTFAQFRARKEEDRSKHFTNKPGKKVKLDRKGNVDCQTKINIGVMVMKDDRLSIKRGYSLPINVTPNITSEEGSRSICAHHLTTLIVFLNKVCLLLLCTS